MSAILWPLPVKRVKGRGHSLAPLLHPLVAPPLPSDWLERLVVVWGAGRFTSASAADGLREDRRQTESQKQPLPWQQGQLNRPWCVRVHGRGRKGPDGEPANLILQNAEPRAPNLSLLLESGWNCAGNKSGWTEGKRAQWTESQAQPIWTHFLFPQWSLT